VAVAALTAAGMVSAVAPGIPQEAPLGGVAEPTIDAAFFHDNVFPARPELAPVELVVELEDAEPPVEVEAEDPQGCRAPESQPPIDYGWVTGAGWPGLRVRQGPGVTSPIRAVLPERTVVELRGPACVDAEGHAWRPIAVPSGVSGWSAADYLTELTSRKNDDQGRPVMRAKLTAYTYQEPVGGAHGSITKSGHPVRRGMVAVDPSLIPLGSYLAIDGFDTVFWATDTGHGVKGPHVDIFFPDHASAVQFGVQYRDVTIHSTRPD
jgi:3D (Asp-Asp-Asp) domain-containing protein